jgi:hypothetical protein
MKTSLRVGAKSKALLLRKKGYSYNYITQHTGIPKSTLSGWLQKVSYSPNKYTTHVIGKARAASALAKSKIRMGDIAEARKEAIKHIAVVSQRDLLMLGIGIYIGEGTKSHEQVRIINSDARIIALAVRWFTEILSVPKDNLRIRLHLYPDSNVLKSTRFWEKQTGIPKHHFQKISVDRRTNKKMLNYGKLPYGTVHLSVLSQGDKRFGKHLARLIFSMIDIVEDTKRD